jgi:YggT family protein
LISLIAQVIDKVITILIFAIVIRAFLSFLPQLKSNKLTMLLNDVTDPLLKPFQRFQIGGAAGAIDFSPIIAIIALNLIQAVIVKPFF